MQSHHIGKAGQHLVCADLILRGMNACIAPEGLPYDILVEYEGKFATIQVKTTNVESWNGHGTSKQLLINLRSSTKREDSTPQATVYAFVSLLTNEIGYLDYRETLLKRALRFKSPNSSPKTNLPKISELSFPLEVFN